ncbi:diguanylate cyclase domain-containing protein [Pelatocladus sp. BLCC-F211]|uniref:GGDEF domain-containing protein n=1 Tax=Pelatocladus sp. BLCC-F211 TaxID=3342752 RepID=UPI0035BAFB0C
MKALSTILLVAESRLYQLLEVLPLGVAVIEKDGNYSYINQTGQKLLGAGQIINLPSEHIASAYQIYRAGTKQLYPSEQLPSVQALAGKAADADDLEIYRQGKAIALQMKVIPVFDDRGEVAYAIAILQDITKHKQTEQDITARKDAEDALKKREAQFRKLAENVPGMIYRYILHPNGSDEFTYLSPRCREIYEIAPELIIQDSQRMWSLVHPDDSLSIQTLIAESLHKPQSINIEHRIVTPSGCVKWIQVIAQAEQQPNGDSIWDGVVIDITERKYTEQLLADYNRTLEQQVRERTIALEQEIWERKRAEDVAKAAEIALRKANLELERLVTLDGLTQVANRRRFDEYLSQEWRRMAREQQYLGLILCDVDYFKSYNDYYGHQAGDTCLKNIAAAMRNTLKRPADLVARYGGEEFAVILPYTAIQGAVAVAQAIQKAIKLLRLPHIQSQISDFITVSFGVSSLIPTHNLQRETLIAAADRALYQAKKQGRDRIVCV